MTVTNKIAASNQIGNIVQTNTEDDSANYLRINQDLTAENNCDDTTGGDNAGSCIIDLHLIVSE